ncbi:hypothetical protein NJ7G_1527 [Natrinema sp. J7-2]|nr:hypothetical protein NJ7G_1527 [Natrinema sp. J7-2]
MGGLSHIVRGSGGDHYNFSHVEIESNRLWQRDALHPSMNVLDERSSRPVMETATRLARDRGDARE